MIFTGIWYILFQIFFMCWYYDTRPFAVLEWNCWYSFHRCSVICSQFFIATLKHSWKYSLHVSGNFIHLGDGYELCQICLQCQHSFYLFSFFPETEVGNTVEKQDKQEYSPVGVIFGSHVVSINKCTKCSHEIHKDTTSLLVNLTFPEVIEGWYYNTFTAFCTWMPSL